MKLDVNGHSDLLLHRRQALRCRQADGGLHPRRAATTTACGSCRAATSPTTAGTCWRSTCPATAGAPARRPPAWRRRALRGRPARRRRRRTGGAGRPQLRLADRAGGGRARAGARDAPGAGRHGLPDEGVAGAAGRLARRAARRRSTWSTCSRIRCWRRRPPPWAPAPGCYGGSRALMRRVLASNREVNVFHRGFKACDDYANGEAAIAAVRCPVLFLLGSADQMTPPRATPLWRPPRRRRTVVGRAGHQLMSEAPDAVLFALRDLLAPNGGPPEGERPGARPTGAQQRSCLHRSTLRRRQRASGRQRLGVGSRGLMKRVPLAPASSSWAWFRRRRRRPFRHGLRDEQGEALLADGRAATSARMAGSRGTRRTTRRTSRPPTA